jgi:mannosyltransferase OCH1-like enzyme
MIPKILYYVWVGNKQIPDEFKRNIEGWHWVMPDYDIRKVTLDDVPYTDHVKNCMDKNLLAAASNYVRCQAIAETGGIYLDTDMETIKRFDDLLDNKMFIGTVDDEIINCAVIGAEPKSKFIEILLSEMDKITIFDLDVTLQTGPYIFTNFSKSLGWINSDETQYLPGLTVYNSKFFYPYHWLSKYDTSCLTSETHAIHHWAGTWNK